MRRLVLRFDLRFDLRFLRFFDRLRLVLYFELVALVLALRLSGESLDVSAVTRSGESLDVSAVTRSGESKLIKGDVMSFDGTSKEISTGLSITLACADVAVKATHNSAIIAKNRFFIKLKI
jgi:hypothetical protein